MAFKINSPIINKLLKNKYLLYVLFAISAMNVLGYLAVNNLHAVVFFIAVGLISTYFTKNMIINLGLALVFTNLMYGKKTVEGLTNKEESSEEKKEESEEDKNKKTCEKCKKEHSDPESEDYKKCVGELKCANDGFQNKYSNEPKSVPESLDDEEEVGDRIDYAATLEQAYNNLEGVLGKDGISNLTKDTEKLIGQQKMLMSTLGNIQPLINSAKKTLSGFNMDDLNKNLSGLTQMMGSLGKQE